MRSIRSTSKAGRGGRVGLYTLAAISAATDPSGRQEETGIVMDTSPAEVPQQAFAKYAEQLRSKKAEDLSKGDKLALKRFGAMKIEEIADRVWKDRQFFQKFDHVDDAHAELADENSTLVVRVVEEGKGSHNQLMHFDPEELGAIKEWLMNIDDEHIRQVMPGRRGEDLIAMKIISPNDYVREALTQIANANDTIRRWLFRSADQHHPLWNDDGTLKDELLPEGWTKIHFKGSGEAPILKEDVHLSDRLQDAYFCRKIEEAHPLDRRCMGAEYDIRRNPNGWIFDMIARKLNAVRPADLDKDYFFDLESEKPFESGTNVEFDENVAADINSRFLVKDPTIGRILGAVPNCKKGPLPAMERSRIRDMAFKAKTIKTYVELAAGEVDSDNAKAAAGSAISMG